MHYLLNKGVRKFRWKLGRRQESGVLVCSGVVYVCDVPVGVSSSALFRGSLLSSVVHLHASQAAHSTFMTHLAILRKLQFS
jgi:hypothetical protein